MKKIFLAALMAVSMAACHDNNYPQYQTQNPNAGVQQPVYVSAPAQSNNGGVLTGALLGGAAGFMAGKLSTRNAAASPAPVNHTTIIQQKVVKNVTVNHAPVVAPVAAPAPKLSLSKPVKTSSNFGGFNKRR
jgi:hypothetical protein